MKAKNIFKGPVIWIVLAVLALILIVPVLSGSSSNRVDTSVGMELLQDNKADQALLDDNESRVDLTLQDDFVHEDRNLGTQVHFFYSADRAETVVDAIAESTLDDYTDEPVQSNWLMSMLGFLIPFIIIALLFWFLLSRMQGGGSQMMKFGKSQAKLMSKDTPQVTFKDVAGSDEAVEELYEIKEFLTEPEKFKAVGAKIPTGVLLYGPPGTGKTLIARALAGEASVPFYTISGSDFVEMFVGVGASRVRDLFTEAKKNAPAIIFVDEIDAVGRHRGAGVGGGNDEREQTLNQLLVEMDGFDENSNVILIAATNRPDVLDPALLRPGRFDRQVPVEAPSLEGRLQILKVHSQGKPLVENIDLYGLAQRTPGFSGADLANVLNEAALLTARSNAHLIDNRAVDEAVDRVMAGPQKKTRLMNDHERRVTAYHEGGHALVAAGLRHSAPVSKVTILPRGRALGYTMVVPDEDKYSVTRNELLDQLAYAMGGRVAEEVVFHDPSTGGSNDITKATDTARKMVTEYGMSARVGTVKLGSGNDEPFYGRDAGSGREYSDELAFVVDEEVRKLLDDAHAEAYWVLNENRDILDDLATKLLEQETLNRHELADIFANVRKHQPRETWLFHEDRPVSDLPPVAMPAGTVTDNSTQPADPADTDTETTTQPVTPAETTDDVDDESHGDDQEK
ncbi:ATP-dependent zinc metalloprotease FtsH [Yaniella flava]|uniref:ATP-dependent zinc metalloprotease FtsH n=1 Tax=Yaniella flava TaxID=287930 RepID=A0ABP5GA09_9MICC